MPRIGITCNQLASDGRPKRDPVEKGPISGHSVMNQVDTSKNSDFGSLRHDLTVPARLTVVFPGVFALA